MTKKFSFLHDPRLLQAGLVLLAIAAAVLGYLLYDQHQNRRSLEADAAAQKTRIAELENTLLETKNFLEEAMFENEELSEDLEEEKGRNEEFQNQIDDIADTVGILDKLSKTDEELLQKYSKVYFLNEHFIPDSLTSIDKEWLYNEDMEKKIHTKVNKYLEDMLEDALEDGVKLWVVSAYRSFNEQQHLKGAYTFTYGSGANAFSADQGYSEHQLGTTVDFTTEGLSGGLVTSFETTPAFKWLTEHAHKYGFTLSYPKGNAYYVYEPWHWRFVGVDLAKDLKRDGAYFYDWDQRKIDEYLISVFD
jgi:LAS superfamily LD-carboxypeptidase LdcB